MADVDPLKAFALFAPEDLEKEASLELGRDQGLLQGVPRSGEVLGEHYTLLEALGRGGMGLVFRGRDERLGREVAVKVLLLEAEEARRRFEREAEVTASLQSRFVVRVFASGFFRGYPFIVYELIEGGRTLLEAFADEPRERRLDLLEEVAEGIAVAHAAGVVHRDLKPENVLVRPTGEAAVLDFGLAGVARSTLTRTGEVMGTPAYMAPEQLTGAEATPACDVWALGLLLYEALYQEHPFLAGQAGLPELLGRIAAARFEFPDGAPPALRDLVTRSAAPQPERRPEDAAAFLDELRAARRAPAPTQGPRFALAGFAAVGLLALGAWVATRGEEPAPLPTRETPTPTASAMHTPEAAERPASPAAESVESLYQRGKALVEGDPPEDYEGGLELLMRAAEGGHPDALYLVGRWQLENGAEGGGARAELLFRRAAALGHGGAMWRLAIMADDDPETSDAEALEWYRQAAKAGKVNALYTYGLTLIEGAHGVTDPQRGMACLEEAASQGFAPAKCQLALRIVTGDHGSKADPPRAIRLLEEAVEAEDALAKYVLGMWLRQGQFVAQDVARGQKLIREAAAQGDPDALEFLKQSGPAPAKSR